MRTFRRILTINLETVNISDQTGIPDTQAQYLVVNGRRWHVLEIGWLFAKLPDIIGNELQKDDTKVENTMGMTLSTAQSLLSAPIYNQPLTVGQYLCNILTLQLEGDDHHACVTRMKGWQGQVAISLALAGFMPTVRVVNLDGGDWWEYDPTHTQDEIARIEAKAVRLVKEAACQALSTPCLALVR